MNPALRSEVLANEDHAVYHTPCSAGMTAVIFRRLSVDVDEWDLLWTKLYGRPIARVYNFFEAAKEVRPEQLTTLIRTFGNKVKPLKEAA